MIKENNSYEYISNIDDVIDEIKDITFKATIIKMKKLEFKQGIIVALTIKDNTATMPAILIGNRGDEFKKNVNNIVINDNYIITGNTKILKDPNDEELDIIKSKLSNIINVGDIFLAIKTIHKN